jgi:hypothetical protein
MASSSYGLASQHGVLLLQGVWTLIVTLCNTKEHAQGQCIDSYVISAKPRGDACAHMGRARRLYRRLRDLTQQSANSRTWVGYALACHRRRGAEAARGDFRSTDKAQVSRSRRVARKTPIAACGVTASTGEDRKPRGSRVTMKAHPDRWAAAAVTQSSKSDPGI